MTGSSGRRFLKISSGRRREVPPAPSLVLLAPTHVLGDEFGVVRHGTADALMEHGVGAAHRADGGQLVDALGHRHQRQQRLERLACERHVQPRHDDHDAPSSELVRDRNQFASEEVRLIDRDEIDVVARGAGDRGRRSDRSRREVQTRVRRDPSASPRVELVREDLDAPACDDRSTHPPEQLFGLAGEHRTGDHLEPPRPFVHLCIMRSPMRADPIRAPFRRARIAVTTTFAVHAVVAGSLGPWIPRLKARSALDAAGLGIALTGFAGGLVVGTRLAGPAIRRFGGRTTVRVGVPLLALAFAVLPSVRGLPALFAAFAGLGLVSGVLDVAMNAQAVDVEQRYGRRVMSAMHGTWSVSMLGGAAMASVAVATGVDIAAYFLAIAVLLVAASFPLLRWLLSPHEVRDEVMPVDIDADRRIRRVVLLSLIAFVAFMTEGIAAEWSAVYLNEGVGTSVATAGLGVVAFAAGMATSRFVIDRSLERFEASAVVRLGEAVGALALASALVLNVSAVSIAAFLLLGLGVGPAVPLAFRAAGRLGLDGRRSALGVVLTAGYVGSILGPIAVGFTADEVGYRAAFVIPVIACVIVVAVAGAVRESGSPRGDA